MEDDSTRNMERSVTKVKTTNLDRMRNFKDQGKIQLDK